jgi:hypothetical protein
VVNFGSIRSIFGALAMGSNSVEQCWPYSA